MQIEREEQGDKITLKLIGRLNTVTAPSLQKTLEQEKEDVTEINMDLERLEYISSSGLRVLLAITKKMKAKGGTMTLYNVNEEVMEVLEITGLNVVLDIR